MGSWSCVKQKFKTWEKKGKKDVTAGEILPVSTVITSFRLTLLVTVWAWRVLQNPNTNEGRIFHSRRAAGCKSTAFFLLRTAISASTDHSPWVLRGWIREVKEGQLSGSASSSDTNITSSLFSHLKKELSESQPEEVKVQLSDIFSGSFSAIKLLAVIYSDIGCRQGNWGTAVLGYSERDKDGNRLHLTLDQSTPSNKHVTPFVIKSPRSLCVHK